MPTTFCLEKLQRCNDDRLRGPQRQSMVGGGAPPKAAKVTQFMPFQLREKKKITGDIALNI